MLYIFDVDGTLADTYGIFVQAFNDAAEQFGFSRYKQEQEQTIRSLEAGEVLVFHGVRPEQFRDVIGALRSGMERRSSLSRLFDGIEAVLKALKERGDTLAIASSNGCDLAQAALGVFYRSFSRADCNIPLREKVQSLTSMRQEFALAGKAVFVSDEIRDVKAAAAASMRFIGVAWGYNTADALREHGCSEVLTEPRQLLEVGVKS